MIRGGCNPATGETQDVSDDRRRRAEGGDRAGRRRAPRLVASSTVEERADLSARVGELHTERRERLGEIIVREMGKPIEQAMGEVDFSAEIYEFYADNAASRCSPTSRSSSPAARARRSCAAARSACCSASCRGTTPTTRWRASPGPNLVIGNTILLKHAPQCPESAAAMEEIFQQAGFPADAYINIYATNEQIEGVIADPRVRGVSLTGSERAGAAVAEIAGRNLKKVVLELGGSDPFILLSTDDLDATVESAVGARLENTGQACNAAKRFIVVDELYEPFLEKFTAALVGGRAGRPQLAGRDDRAAVLGARRRPARGPGQARGRAGREARHRRRARGQLLLDHRADRHHAGQRRLPRGVLRPGRLRLPRRLGGRGGRAGQRHAVRARLLRLHDRPGAGAARRRQIDAGMVFVNAVGAEGAELPFGGVKRSGFGRELGRFGADEFVNKKLIRVGA